MKAVYEITFSVLDSPESVMRYERIARDASTRGFASAVKWARRSCDNSTEFLSSVKMMETFTDD